MDCIVSGWLDHKLATEIQEFSFNFCENNTENELPRSDMPAVKKSRQNVMTTKFDKLFLTYFAWRYCSLLYLGRPLESENFRTLDPEDDPWCWWFLDFDPLGSNWKLSKWFKFCFLLPALKTEPTSNSSSFITSAWNSDWGEGLEVEVEDIEDRCWWCLRPPWPPLNLRSQRSAVNPELDPDAAPLGWWSRNDRRFWPLGRTPVVLSFGLLELLEFRPPLVFWLTRSMLLGAAALMELSKFWFIKLALIGLTAWWGFGYVQVDRRHCFQIAMIAGIPRKTTPRFDSWSVHRNCGFDKEKGSWAGVRTWVRSGKRSEVLLQPWKRWLDLGCTRNRSILESDFQNLPNSEDGGKQNGYICNLLFINDYFRENAKLTSFIRESEYKITLLV